MTKNHILMSRNFILLLLLAGFLSSNCPKRIQLQPKHVKNFHQVDSKLYRSAQPQRKGMKSLESFGIKTIVNLRNVQNDKQEVRGTNLTRVRIAMRAKKITYENIVTTLCEIEKAKKPVLIHCLHGSDRTGCMIAAYRMTHGWSKEQAIKEFLNTKFGYNKSLFPNILTLLQSLNVEQLKKDVNCTTN